MTNVLDVTDLAASYGMHEALHGVSLHVDIDEIVVILGANGAGKSTLLKAIAGICEGDSSGSVTLDGSSISGLDPAEIVERGIAFVPEGRGIFGDLSVLENLNLGAYAEHARASRQHNLQRVFGLFPKLAERKKQIARTMSGGEQQMVAIGRALMSAPSVLMLDEPSLGLSPLLCKELFSSLQQVRETGVGILLVEQNARQSLGIADRGYLLENGSIIGEDSASKLLHDSSVQAAYLGGAVSSKVPATTIVTIPAATKVAEAGGIKTPENSTIVPRTSPAWQAPASAGTLAGEDIDALVARASATALQAGNNYHSVQTAVKSTQQFPTTQASSLQASSLQASSLQASSTQNSITRTGLNHVSQNQNCKVQQLLADFEQAARHASSTGLPIHSPASGQNRPPSPGAGDRDDINNLPHIPVFRKSTVTVFRRDNTGTLRKQERS